MPTSAIRLRRLCAGLLAPPMLAALGACSNLSENDCRTANWEDIGYKDGVNGAPHERSAGHAETCSKYGATVDEGAWDKGYQRGIEEYCAPEHAIQVGMRGSQYNGVCPEGLDAQFQNNWRAGRIVYDQRKRVDSLQQRRGELENAYRQAVNDQQRYELQNELQAVDQALGEERLRLGQAEAQLRQYQHGIK